MLSSPFPGIDPYIKAQGSCRTSTPASSRICAMRWLISCPFNYEARIDERLNLVELPAEKLRRIKPDLAVSRGELSRGPSPVSAGVVTLEPVTIPLVIEEEARETYIEILHRPDRTFVTVIELLSPSNKEDPGRALFLAKTEFAAVPAGPRRRTGPADLSPAIAAFESLSGRAVLCARRARQLAARLSGLCVDRSAALPSVPIPLVAPDPGVWITLDAVFSTTFDRGHYARSLDYTSPFPSSVDDQLQRWIQETARV